MVLFWTCQLCIFGFVTVLEQLIIIQLIENNLICYYHIVYVIVSLPFSPPLSLLPYSTLLYLPLSPSPPPLSLLSPPPSHPLSLRRTLALYWYQLTLTSNWVSMVKMWWRSIEELISMNYRHTCKKQADTYILLIRNIKLNRFYFFIIRYLHVQIMCACTSNVVTAVMVVCCTVCDCIWLGSYPTSGWFNETYMCLAFPMLF